MKIQLNAALEDGNASNTTGGMTQSVSHIVRMSSLLSNDVSTPQEAPHRVEIPSFPVSRSGLSSLMNSPLPDDQEDKIALHKEPQIVDFERDTVMKNVEMEEEENEPVLKMAKLQTSEMQTLQGELHAAFNKLWRETTPAPKRQKKGKQNRRTKAAAVNNSNAAEMEVLHVLDQLQRTLESQFVRKSILQDMITLCLTFCELVDDQEPMLNLVVQKDDEKKIHVDFDKTFDKLSSKPLYEQVMALLQRTVLCGDEATGKHFIKQVLDWCLSRPTPLKWTWMLVAIGRTNSYLTLTSLFREAMARYHGAGEDENKVLQFLPVVEILAEKHPVEMVDIVRNILEEVASDDNGSIDRLRSLIALASDSAVLVAICDENLQWIVTEKIVMKLGWQFEKERNTRRDLLSNKMEAQLLDFIRKRSAELMISGFQLLLLLQNLLAQDLSPWFASAVASFQKHLCDFARSEPSGAFLKGIYHFLPFICRSALQLLQEMDSAGKTPPNVTGITRERASQRFEEWKYWLCLLAQSISRTEVTELLVKTDLMMAEFNDGSPHPMDQPVLKTFCELLTSLLVPLSPEYVAFVRTIVQESQSAAPKAQRRILSIVQMLLKCNDTSDKSAWDLRVPLSVDNNVSCMEQLYHARSWSERFDLFDLWKGVRGVELWESFLNLTLSNDALVASQALSIVFQTSFQSLEDPAWQYRCIRKLLGVFFSVLRQFRLERVTLGANTSTPVFQHRLQTLKMILFRIIALDGGVAYYPSSIYSMFASLWMDAVLSTTSPTSIPTHFENRLSFEACDPSDVFAHRQIIRSERTISSKCTNLQSSQVITKVAETKLVYRKTLDSSWERELQAARVCSVYATDLFSQLLVPTEPAPNLLDDEKSAWNTEENEQLERRLKIVVDMLLERVIPCCGIPNDDVYKDMLPNRSSFDVDLRVEQWLNHFPAILPLLRTVVSTSTMLGSVQLLRLVPVFKSALIVLLGHWNSVKGDLSVDNVDVPPYMRNQNQLAITCDLMRLLRATNWLPLALGNAAELLPLTTPADIRSILFSCWFYLSDHPPKHGSRAPTPATSATTSPISSGSSPAGLSITGLSSGGITSSGSYPPLEFYLVPLRKALHRNIRKIGVKYPLFSC